MLLMNAYISVSELFFPIYDDYHWGKLTTLLSTLYLTVTNVTFPLSELLRIGIIKIILPSLVPQCTWDGKYISIFVPSNRTAGSKRKFSNLEISINFKSQIPSFSEFHLGFTKVVQVSTFK
jgi:hypothetical protein